MGQNSSSDSASSKLMAPASGMVSLRVSLSVAGGDQFVLPGINQHFRRARGSNHTFITFVR